MKARIIKIISNQYTIIDEKHNEYNAICSGKIRLQIKPKVGDLVIFESIEDKYVIEKILPRTNELIRPPIANINNAIICMSAKKPDFSNVLVDRLIFLASYANINPMIYITKMDLVDDNDIIYTYINDYRKSGYTVFEGHKDRIDKNFFNALNNSICVLMGQSGVGKSSLMNLIDPNYMLKTQEISKALNRGKHTTRHSQLYILDDILLADTPGFSALEFKDIDINIFKDSIIDFKPYINKCKFNDCTHIHEPNCAIKLALEQDKISNLRYNNYKEVINLIKKGDKLL